MKDIKYIIEYYNMVTYNYDRNSILFSQYSIYKSSVGPFMHILNHEKFLTVSADTLTEALWWLLKCEI